MIFNSKERTKPIQKSIVDFALIGISSSILLGFMGNFTLTQPFPNIELIDIHQNNEFIDIKFLCMHRTITYKQCVDSEKAISK